MPGRRHLQGVGAKEQRQYEHIKEQAQKEGRYGRRAAEVAARTVLKQHARKGHRKGSDGRRARHSADSGGPPCGCE